MDYVIVFIAIGVVAFAAFEFVRLIRKSDAESEEIIRQGKESGEI